MAASARIEYFVSDTTPIPDQKLEYYKKKFNDIKAGEYSPFQKECEEAKIWKRHLKIPMRDSLEKVCIINGIYHSLAVKEGLSTNIGKKKPIYLIKRVTPNLRS